MELQSFLRQSGGSRLSRRALMLTPFFLAGTAAWCWLARQRPLPDPAEDGAGELVQIVLFSDRAERLETVQVKMLAQTPDEWRKQLAPEAFAVTRRAATEFAFHNLYWDSYVAGLYRCVCCGNALFRSKDKFDSETGWPSFTTPVALENISCKPDRTLGLTRTEVLCRKCDGHLGHLFDDGPGPDHNRYCLNSAALRFIAL